MEITKREILSSITIAAIWLCLGFFIAERIDTWQQDKNMEYNKAARIEDAELFIHAMNTNLGNAFVYGELRAVDPVEYTQISGQYFYIERIKERYTKNTRTVTKTRTNAKGKTETYTDTETYWTWDEISRESKTSDAFVFLEQQFDGSKIDLPSADYIDTIKESPKIRYEYYGIPDVMAGTIYTVLKDGTIKDDSEFYEGQTIEEAVKALTTEWCVPVFWIGWLLALTGIVIGFYYLDNYWLNS